MAKNFSIPLANNPKLPLNGFTPVAWMVEIVRGCNLKCWHCATTLFPKGHFEFMSSKTFIEAMNIIKAVSPKTRIEFVNAGEPSLHPDLYSLISTARVILPEAQLGIITNGTTILSGKVTYKGMFNAGLNIALVDIYGSKERHEAIAAKSGHQWYYRGPASTLDKKAPKAWTNNHDPKIKTIILQANPDDWPDQKSKKSFLATFLNDLNWDLVEGHGLEPVVVAPNRRCDQPSKNVNICADGDYIFCCQDLLKHNGSKLGNVSDGVDGFQNFWLGNYMQSTRNLLNKKNRRGHALCSRCKMCTTRCDIPFWPEESLNKYYRNGEWIDIDPSEVTL